MIWFCIGVVVGVFLPVKYNMMIKDTITKVWSKITKE